MSNKEIGPKDVRMMWWIGVCFLGIGAYLVVLLTSIFIFGATLDGTVLIQTVEYDADNVSAERHYTVVEFQDPKSGKPMRQKLLISDLPWRKIINGERISLRYWSLPQLLVRNAFWDNFALPLIIILIGLVMVSAYRLACWLLTRVKEQSPLNHNR